LLQSGAFSPDQARASLEVSLRELRTDRIDVLLLHEAGVSDCSGELLAFLQDQQRADRIGTYGVGSPFSRIRDILRDRPDVARVVQFESNVINRNREVLGVAASSAVITHGALSESYGRLRGFLTERPDTCGQWSEALGVNLANQET